MSRAKGKQTIIAQRKHFPPEDKKSRKATWKRWHWGCGGQDFLKAREECESNEGRDESSRRVSGNVVLEGT